MGIKTVLHRPYSPDLTPYDFWLFPKLRDCRYETIEEMKEAVTKVIDTLRQEDFHGALQKLLEQYNKCIAAGGAYFKGGLEFHACTINKSAYTKTSLETYLMILVNCHPQTDCFIVSQLFSVARHVEHFIWDRNMPNFTLDLVSDRSINKRTTSAREL